MADVIASVDAGNGGTNAAILKPNGKPKSIYFPTVRAAATGDSLGLGKELELRYDCYDWNGFRYLVGDDVIRVSKRNLERHMGQNRYGNEAHQFFTAVALLKLGVKNGTVDLTLFAPPGIYREAKQNMEQYFMENDGLVEIGLKGKRKPYQWKYEKINVYPEGIGAAACFILDEAGAPVQSDILSGETLIVDSGVYTLDALRMSDGNFNPESLGHSTWDNGGIDVHIRQLVLQTLQRKGDDFAALSVDDVDLVIRKGLTSGDYTLRVAGYEVNLQPLIDKHRERYAEWLANNVLDGAFDGLRGIKSLILVGGGTVLIEDFIREWYGDKVLDRKKHAGKIHPTEFNCIGGLRLAQMRLQQQ